MAARIRRVTATRARSALDEARRLRPPSPVASRTQSRPAAPMGMHAAFPPNAVRHATTVIGEPRHALGKGGEDVGG
jgi:hypothetical protein